MITDCYFMWNSNCNKKHAEIAIWKEKIQPLYKKVRFFSENSRHWHPRKLWIPDPYKYIIEKSVSAGAIIKNWGAGVRAPHSKIPRNPTSG